MEQSSFDAYRVRQARWAVSADFFIFGFAWAIWAVHIPVIAHRLALDPAVLGFALLNVGLGGVISQPLVGWLMSRIGSRPATQLFLPFCIAAPMLPIVASTIPVLFGATLALGLIGGAANVAVNTQAAQVEAARGKPTMSSFHGFFSLGGLSGALAGSVIIGASAADGRGAIAIIAPLFILSLLAGWFLIEAPPKPPAAKSAKARGLAIPAVAFLALAVICFFANTIEGAAGDWSALYLATIRNLPQAVATSGYAVFSLGMAVCRLAGGPIVARLGDRNVVLLGGLLAALGMAVVVFVPWAALSPFGFALVAIGAANTIPVLISAGSRVPGAEAGTGVAAVATGALLGLLLGPPVIGFVAHSMGLAAALTMMILVGLIVAGGAAVYRWPAAARPQMVSER